MSTWNLVLLLSVSAIWVALVSTFLFLVAAESRAE
jgi:hypothetical protein